ncbi:hypothetical protein Pmani_014859 [Petrolisthes manimaculis]|uniref:Uncharacterized protein n=1 Tax=Petrolisthes manimaculis TaxID=1843537 RepID=A0AAE1PS35_9EUCA|nr:hypothetical protein Pmani_014859 [Petrolisthes manimaculis]
MYLLPTQQPLSFFTSPPPTHTLSCPALPCPALPSSTSSPHSHLLCPPPSPHTHTYTALHLISTLTLYLSPPPLPPPPPTTITSSARLQPSPLTARPSKMQAVNGIKDTCQFPVGLAGERRKSPRHSRISTLDETVISSRRPDMRPTSWLADWLAGWLSEWLVG